MGAPDRIGILLVDGSDAFLEGARAWLASRADARVLGTASSGAEALVQVDRLAPDLVLIDGVVPDLGGFRTMRAIKARPRAPRVVIVTFHASDELCAAALEAGADGVLPKADFAERFDALLARLGAPRAP